MPDDLVRVDFLVLGSGIAGLRAALGLARHGEVLVVTKDQPTESNTGYAQGGVAVAMKADLRICDATAKFGVPAARLGVGYPLDAVRDLVNLVGPSKAKTILFTAERLSAQEAKAIGLADEVLAPEALEGRIAEIAAAIVDNAPLSIRAAKAAIDHVARGAFSEAEVAAIVSDCYRSADFKEGRTAFLEKRRPAFKGA